MLGIIKQHNVDSGGQSACSGRRLELSGRFECARWSRNAAPSDGGPHHQRLRPHRSHSQRRERMDRRIGAAAMWRTAKVRNSEGVSRLQGGSAANSAQDGVQRRRERKVVFFERKLTLTTFQKFEIVVWKLFGRPCRTFGSPSGRSPKSCFSK